ncbi:MAG: PQQ-like beta-propeller repeat protein [Pirellulales bacterium]|nr:PQQ-like beta-propeller repeat protein [Pirellulales bacterium]
MRPFTLACLLAIGVAGGSAVDRCPAVDLWPQFRGVDGQGHAETTKAPLTWSKTENITWRTPLSGLGWSSPLVDERHIWLTAALDEGKSLHALCIDRASGSVVNDIEVFLTDEPLHVNAKNSHASPTGVLESGRLYVHFGAVGTACIDTATGDILWRNQDLKIDHKEGPGSSPIIHGDRLFVNCDGIDLQYVAALDKHTGNILWRSIRLGEHKPDGDLCKAYSTPLVVRVDDKEQLVSVGADRTAAYDLATGQEIWHVVYDGYSNVPRPIVGHGLVFFATGYNKPQLWAVRPEGTGNVTDTHVVWREERQVPANPSPILVGDAVYFVGDKGVASCLDALTGETRFRQRLGGNYSASPVLAAGRIYFFSEEGASTVIAASNELEVLAKNELDERIMATPAFVDGVIYLRTDAALYRIED